MILVERKTFELKQKLLSLKREFGMWREESRRFGPLEKHNSQIHGITNLLESHCATIQERLEGLAVDGEELLKQSTDLEMQMLELHRIWEFFRSKFALRSVKWFNSYLAAADDFAWACYEAAQKRVNAEHIPYTEIKEPPLVFFNGGSSPFSMPRKVTYQAEDVPDEIMNTEEFFELLNDLPIPLIGIPWFQIQHLPEALVIGHEVGHIVRDDFCLKSRTKKLLEKGMDKVPEVRRTAWRKWLDEVFADIYGTLATGPSFVSSLMDFLANGKDDITQEKLSSADWGLYPTVYLRILVNLEVLLRQGFTKECKELKATWCAMFKSHAMPEFVDDISAIVESLVVGPYPEFGNVALTDVLKFSKLNQAHTSKIANSLLSKGPIGTVDDVRVLYAASRWAFAKDAGAYEKQDIQTKILDKILAIRKDGVRGIRAQNKTGTFDERDKLAGKKLFEKLEQLLSPQ